MNKQRVLYAPESDDRFSRDIVSQRGSGFFIVNLVVAAKK
jgi:hypothetical protein